LINQNPITKLLGKRRLETLAVIIFAAIMFTATCQLILKSFEAILNMVWKAYINFHNTCHEKKYSHAYRKQLI
jgi:hypothetical protein